jgi:hypothetical protein
VDEPVKSAILFLCCCVHPPTNTRKYKNKKLKSLCCGTGETAETTRDGDEHLPVSFFLPTTTGGCVSIIMTHRASAGQQQSFRLSLLFSFFFDRRCTREDDGQTRADIIISLSIYLRYMSDNEEHSYWFLFIFPYYTRERRTLAVCAGRRRRRELCFSLRFVSRPRRWSLRLRTDHRKNTS